MRLAIPLAILSALCLSAPAATSQPAHPKATGVTATTVPINQSHIPQFYIRPGLTGIYAQLEAEAQHRPGPGPFRNLGPTIPTRVLAPYQPYATPQTPPEASKFNLRQIVVKFVEGSAIRLRNDELVISASADAQETRPMRLGRSGLEPQDVDAELSLFNQIVRKVGSVRRATTRVEETDLTLLRHRAEANTGLEQPDLNLFYFVILHNLPPEAIRDTLARLRKLRMVETAYFQPIPFDATDIPPPTTIDVTNSQGYFMSAPVGVDVNFARRFAGGQGEGVRIADIESGWNGHEDLPDMAFRIGTSWGGDHGTAVIGELTAEVNGFGANGIAPNAAVGWSSVSNLDPFEGFYIYSVSDALLHTGLVLRAGDIALIEQHYPTISPGPCPNTCNCAQFGFVAVETMPFEHAAISQVTGAGGVVVEAAGNGQTLVTPASTRDSGAIIVGASDPFGAGAALCFTNFGPRVNVRAWGASVGSTGFGDDASLRANGSDSRQWYTRVFSGTSSASPIVTGAAALIQSTRAAAGLAKLTSVQLRTLLVSTGTPQSSGVAIGPQPDLRAAISSYIPDLAQFVSQTNAPASVTPGSGFTVSATFKNTGSGVWTGDHAMSMPQTSGAAWPPPQGFAVGTTSSPVMPSDQVTKAFSFTAPSQPGTYRLVFALLDPVNRILATSPAQTVVVAAANTGFDNATLTIATQGSMPANSTGPASVTAVNTGTTTWDAGYSLSLLRSGRISLPNNSVPVTGTVAPGQSKTFNFQIVCNGQGNGGFSAQMQGPNGDFGASAGITIYCDPNS
jgi:hypothetical protein